MHRYPFIFSDERRYRLQRHLLFWTCWWVFQSLLYSFAINTQEYSFVDRLKVSSLNALVYLLPHLFLAYSLMYWVVPQLMLKGKYIRAVFGVLFLFVATALISALLSMYILHPLRIFILGPALTPPKHVNDLNFFLALLAGLRGAITIGGLAAAIKLMKYWYVKEQRNLQLQKENMGAQLQLLKAQVHPHFLFNTLNNIYAHTQNTAPIASHLILGLSDLLRYMLYECNQPLVPLHKELKMLQDYILLEQIRYGNKLDVHVSLPTTTDNLMIAPLLLLPFVENAFKHGASHMLEQPWVNLHITLSNDCLKMKLLNAKLPVSAPDSASGIGIQNVQQRLELLYPGKHVLEITNDEEVFIVHLKLQLESSSSAAILVTPAYIVAHA